MRASAFSRTLCVALAACTLATAVAAQAPFRSSAGGGGAATKAGVVTGTAWNADNSPVSNALIRLRDLTTGRIVLGVEADAAGRFGFDPVPAASYVVELVDQAGTVRAVGQMFSVGPGETVATFVRLSRRDRWFDGFFGNAAAAALSAAASLGLTAVGDGVQPASPRF
ncbi:MAG: carboxypeptidase-like regulatory domain-containing protein [Vicinamibacterales bacterium]